MSGLRDAIDHTMLGWIKPELDEVLRQARVELERFAEAPGEVAPLRQCAGCLRQAAGTLRMVELHAPALVAEEMERLAEALHDGAASDRDTASSALLRGLLLLPDYLERLQGGHRDIPIVLLPLLNELRAARGASALHERMLFAADPAAPSAAAASDGEAESAVALAPTPDAARTAFDAGDGAPSDAEIEHARGSLAGRNRALLATVSTAVKDDLLRVKDALDLHLRTGAHDAAALQPQARLLARVADTLGMLGLDAACAVVGQQREALDAIVDGAAPADEAALLDVAGALLYVEATLDDQVARLGSGSAGDGDATLAAEARQSTAVAVREAIAGFADARQALVAFVETRWDRDALREVPRLLGEVAGALEMLDQPEAAACLAGVRQYVDRELLAGHRIPDAGQLDTFADAVASLEYFLDALREQRPRRDDMLDVARSRLQALGYWPLPADRATGPVAAEDDASMPAFDPDAVLPDEREAIVPAALAWTQADDGRAAPRSQAATAAPMPDPAPDLDPVVADRGGPPRGGFAAVDGDIDDEIREVFLEELADEIAHLDTLLPDWRQRPGDPELLRPLRRVFHTLKGNGRLVGAVELGEFAWTVEALLNRVLEGLRPASPAVVAAVELASQALPAMQAALRAEAPLTLDVDALAEAVARIAAGDEALPSLPPVGAGDAPAPPDPAPADVQTVPARIDALLLEILDAEANGHLQTVDAWLEAARSGDAFDVERLLRALHTMHGAFAMAEVPVVGLLLGPAEEYARRLVAMPAPPDPDAVDAIDALCRALREALARLHDDDPRIAALPVLAARLCVVRDRLASPPAPTYDFADPDAPIAGDEAVEVDHWGAVRAEAELLEAQRFEAERLEAERLETARLDAERLEAERRALAEAAQLEAARVDAERQAAARLEAERLEAERLESERLEAERLEAERLEAERLEAERLEAERLEAESLEAERLETERIEAERLAAEQAETARLEAEREEAGRRARDVERLEAERRDGAALAARQRQAAIDADVLAGERLRYEAAAARRRATGVTLPQAAAEASDAPVVAEASAPDASVPDTEASPGASRQGNDADGDPEAPLDLSGLDPDLIDIFVGEGIDLLDDADALLEQLRDDPAGFAAIAGLQRDLHTLKGGARMAGLMAIGDLGHAMETLLEAIAGRRAALRPAELALLERGFDRLHAMIVRAGERRAIGPSQALVDAFAAIVQGTGGTGATGDATPARPALAPLSAPLPLPGSDDESDDGTGRPQEQVRIRAELLDRLVTYAGEVAIYRARLEQQLGTFRGAMLELAQTNDRLRDQLRRLDIETEAQIVARYQREGDTRDVAFDPLELDRFSTLQQLARALGETAADLGSLQQTLDDQTRHYESLLQQQSRVSSDLQEGLMRTRMVPFDGLVPRLRRVVRQAAQDTGKQVQLHLDGTQGELDRNVLERMVSPLEHLLRNAVAHGLETPQARRLAGKPEEGGIRISVRREGSEIVLEVADDGAGLDRAAIRRRARDRGLLAPDAEIADGDLDALILQAGFSTAAALSHVAGRGVGLDVVAREVRQLGGSVDIRSQDGAGTAFVLRLPQTLAVTQAAFVRIGETTFAVPIASVRGVGRIARDALRADGAYRYGDEDYDLHDLGTLVGQAPARAEGHLQMPLLLIRAGDLRAAVAVDEILGNREIVVKPVGPQLTSIPGIFGATIMGDGRVVVILDIAPLARRQAAQRSAPDPAHGAPLAVETRAVPLVLVVDDSITMRKVTGRTLERQGLEVLTAKDGLDALERMDERIPDLVLLDIEMPRMDGYELAARMKADPRLRNLPIMMITSRTGEKHRERALEIGVDRYLGKPYQEAELLRHVHGLLGLEHDDD